MQLEPHHVPDHPVREPHHSVGELPLPEEVDPPHQDLVGVPVTEELGLQVHRRHRQRPPCQAQRVAQSLKLDRKVYLSAGVHGEI